MTKSFEDGELIDPVHLIFISKLEEEYKIYDFLDFWFFSQIIWFTGKKTMPLKNDLIFSHFPS